MNKILKQVHPYSIFYSECDGRWHTTITDLTKVSGRKSIARKRKGDLEKFLLEHYQIELNPDLVDTTKPTFRELFYISAEKKLQYIKNPEKLISAKNTALKNNSDFRRYFEGTDFADKEIDTISRKDIEDICLFNLQRYDMRKKHLHQ